MPELNFTDAELDRLADALADRVRARLAPEQRPALMSVNAVAAALGCHPKTVRRRIDAGVFSAVRDQGRVLLRTDEIDTYLESLSGASSSSRRRRRRSRDLGLDFLHE